MGKNKIWFQGKGIPPTLNQREAPLEGEPNTYITFYDEKGNLHRIRTLDESGRAKKDFDRGYPKTREPDDHVHSWVDKKRLRGRKLDKRERAFFNRKKKKLRKGKMDF